MSNFANRRKQRWISTAWIQLIAAASLAAGCATVRHDVPRPVTRAIDDPLQTTLGRNLATQLAATPGSSGFRLFPSGQEAFVVRAALAEGAQRTLDLQYYIVAPDATGTLLIYRALRAAERGVRVRLLIDDLGASGRDLDFATLAAHANVQVRVFNPFLRRGLGSLSRMFDYFGDGRLNRRMHNKLWIADNAAALIGGRNLGDAYFNADGQTNFADLDVLVAGPVVAEASRSFDEYWNSEWAVPIEAFTGRAESPAQVQHLMTTLAARANAFRDSDYARALRSTDLAVLVRSGQVALTTTKASVLYDSPDKLLAGAPEQEVHVVSSLRTAIESAQKELILTSPYFVPSERGVAMLCGLTRRGVRVRVLTNSLASTDVAAVHAGYARYRPRLLACAVELNELKPSVLGPGRVHRVLSSEVSLHAKALMVDGRTVLIGSMNLDPRSRSSNTEVGVLIDSDVLGRQLGKWFDDATSLDRAARPELAQPGDSQASLTWVSNDDDGPVRYTSEPLASWWQRIVSGLLGLLVPEELL